MLRQSERALTTPLPRVYDFDPEQNKPAPTTEATLAMSGEALGEQNASGALADTGEGLKVHSCCFELNRERRCCHLAGSWRSGLGLLGPLAPASCLLWQLLCCGSSDSPSKALGASSTAGQQPRTGSWPLVITIVGPSC